MADWVFMLAWNDLHIPGGPRLRLVANPSAVLAIDFHATRAVEGDPAPDNPILAELSRQLVAYFAGTLRVFELPLAPQGTEFQKRVWRHLEGIPFGETRSYRQVADAIGASHAVRAVGAANGANPIPIVIPCHRVIGANGKLTGYGGGLPLKKRLLELEGAWSGSMGW